MKLPILYEDADVVAVAKPAGLVTHSDGRTKEETAEEWFEKKYPGSGGGYVHRLDRDTSGVLVFAKNAAAYEFLRKAFHDRDVKKTYLAFVYGVPKQKKESLILTSGGHGATSVSGVRNRKRKGDCAMPSPITKLSEK